MNRFVLETLALIAALFSAAWLLMWGGDQFFFRNVGAQAVGILPNGYPDIEEECRGLFYSTSDPIEYRINRRGELILRCPLRLFPIVRRVKIDSPPPHLMDQLKAEHRKLVHP